MPVSAAVNPLTKTEIEALANEWCQKLDQHAPLAEILPLLASEGLELTFAEATIRNRAEFECWYEELIRTHFDETRTAQVVRSKFQSDGADVQIVVHWETSVWMPPAAKSERITLDAHQTWQVVRAPDAEQPLIVRLNIDKLVYADDSARL
jgi:hypothetical protein